MLPAKWPEELREYIKSVVAPISDVRLLSGGQSGAIVYLIAGAGRNVVVKNTLRPGEPIFYFDWVPILRSAGVPVPELYSSWYIPGESAYGIQDYLNNSSFGLRQESILPFWLVIEHIPSPLPPERFLADAEMLGVLHRLHSIPFRFNSMSGNVAHLYEPKWTESMTSSIVQFLPEGKQNELIAFLGALRKSAEQLFLPKCFISGDPNRTNCGLRADGSLVLFDWERFGLGTPPLDLAIATPGLPSIIDIRKTAQAYALHSSADIDVDALARDIAVAKVWNIVEYVHEAMGASAQP